MSKESTATRKRSRRRFSDEFKQDAVNLVVVQGYSFKRAADAVGVSSRSLRSGVRSSRQSPMNAVTRHLCCNCKMRTSGFAKNSSEPRWNVKY